MSGQRARQWTWTLNNYTEEEVQCLKDLGEIIETKAIRYLCWGVEVGAEGTPHLQGFVANQNARTMSAMKKLLGSTRYHLERTKGTALQNQQYCQKKDGESMAAGILPNQEFYEWGVLPDQGKRSDLLEIKELIDDGVTEIQIAQDYFGQWVRYREGFRQYRTLVNRPKVVPNYPLDSFPQTWQDGIYNWDKTLIFWGPPDTGKTEFASALLPGALMVSHMDDLKNFDPEFHNGIIFDDVDIKHHPRTSQIHLTDQTQDRSVHIRYACGFIPKNTKKIFTTNEEGGHCMLLEDGAIRRRVDIHHFIKD